MLETNDIQQTTNHETIERLSHEVERLRALLEFQAIKAAVHDEGSKNSEIDLESTDY